MSNRESVPLRDRAFALAKLAGREALLAKLEKSFSRDAPADLERLEKAMAAGDADELALVSHKLKGEANTVGALRLGKTAQAFHEAAKAGNAAALADMFPALAMETRAAIKAMG